jgi:VIT1/CCC1 family predicted Fe2+/Mn2+ transporter
MSEADHRARQKGYSDGPGDRRLRATVLWVVAAQSLFLVFLTVFLFNHANPKGDGMEMVGVGAAFMLIFLPLSLPAFLLAKEWRYLVVAAVLAGLAAFAYFAIWFQLLDELHISAAPWS